MLLNLGMQVRSKYLFLNTFSTIFLRSWSTKEFIAGESSNTIGLPLPMMRILFSLLPVVVGVSESMTTSVINPENWKVFFPLGNERRMMTFLPTCFKSSCDCPCHRVLRVAMVSTSSKSQQELRVCCMCRLLMREVCSLPSICTEWKIGRSFENVLCIKNIF